MILGRKRGDFALLQHWLSVIVKSGPLLVNFLTKQPASLLSLLGGRIMFSHDLPHFLTIEEWGFLIRVSFEPKINNGNIE
jgi:hypothetical protein